MISFLNLLVELLDDLRRDLLHASGALHDIHLEWLWLRMDLRDDLGVLNPLDGHQGLVLLALLVRHRDLGLLLEELQHLALGAYSHGGQDEKCWRCTYGRTGGTP